MTKVKDLGRKRFVAQGPDAVDYNRFMTALLTATDVIEPGRQAEPVPSSLVDPYRQISTRYLGAVAKLGQGRKAQPQDISCPCSGVLKLSRISG